jgi:N-acetylmuramoyl-L-alanine amidase
MFTGCATQRADRDTAAPIPQNAEQSLQVVEVPPGQIPKVPVESGLPSTVPNGYLEPWLSFERWCREQDLPTPYRLEGPTTRFASDTSAGRLVLSAENVAASWQGIEVWLGFAPRFIDGKLFVHGVDAAKTLLPLVESQVSLPRARRVIVLDPGHGGENAGTKSVLGEFYEKTYTLDWAKRLAPLLEAQGWSVVLTRSNDVSLTLAERVAIADRERADLFISLHFNSAAPSETQAGLETYCLTPKGLPSNLVRDFEDDLTAVFPNNTFDADNLRLAVRLHRELLAINGMTDRGVRHARFMGVLRGQNRPATLIEGGYLSHPAEARRIADPLYRQQLADAVARALQLNKLLADVPHEELTEAK